jgi:hypothetical protein
VKIEQNFLVVSNYNNDIGWVADYSDSYLVYDQSESPVYPKNLDLSRVIKSPHLGHNIRDYCTYLYDHYEDLPDVVILASGNVFPRHVSQAWFNRVMNNRFYTPIEEMGRHKERWPVSFFSSDGGYCEVNNSWYLDYHPTKFFHDYNDFLRFCFKDPIIPRFIRFAPGANCIVPRANLLKIPREFYGNLRTFVSHCPAAIPGESHIIERALDTLWNCNFEVSVAMRSPLDEATFPFKPKPMKSPSKRSFSLFKKSEKDILEYNRTLKTYDIFTIFNELDLLEIRLNILDPYVDYFVIVEATETFSGNPKPLYYSENKQRFQKFHPKIIHYVTTDAPASEEELRARLDDPNTSALNREIIGNALTSSNVPKGELHWLKEFYQKESIKKALVGLGENDACYVSDVDEIWNPEAVVDFRRDDIFKLRQIVSAYYFDNRSSEPWAGTLATKYKNIRDNCLNHLRTASKTQYTYVKNGGWHFTNLGGADQIRLKLASYGHQEFNTDEVRSRIEARMKGNEDFIGRKFKLWQDDKHLPEFLKAHRSEYRKYFKND